MRMNQRRAYLHFLAGRGRLTADAFRANLESTVHADARDWLRFLRIGLLSAGSLLVVSGILFLLAYNWDALTKGQQLGFAATAVALPVALSLAGWVGSFTRRVFLTAAAIMVGGLLAVFGQIYQTGADNYTYLLSWWLFITVWTLVADFPLLWLVWITVGNLTLYFYGEQVLDGWRTYQTLGMQTIVTGGVLLGLSLFSRHRGGAYPRWFLNTVALAVGIMIFSVVFLTTWVSESTVILYVIRFGMVGLLAAGLAIGYFRRWLGLLSVFALSFIASVTVMIFGVSDGPGIWLLAAGWALGGTTAAGMVLNTLRLSWLGTERPGEGVEEDQSAASPSGELPGVPPIGTDNDRIAWSVKRHESQPLGIQLVSLFGGILTFLTLMGVLFALGLFDGELSYLIVGLVFVGGAYHFDHAEHGLFLDALIVATMTTGVILLFLYVAAYEPAVWQSSLSALALCAGVYFTGRNKLLLLLSVVGMHLSVIYLVVEGIGVQYLQYYLLAVGLGLVYLMLMEHRIVSASAFWSARFSPTRAASTLVILATASIPWYYGYYDGGSAFMGFEYLPGMVALLVAAIVIAVRTLRGLSTNPATVRRWGPVLALLLFPLSLAPAASPALLILVLSVKTGYRLGAVIAAVALVYFVGQYYYDLNLSLFVKSGVLVGSGLYFLLAYAILRNKFPTHEAFIQSAHRS